MNSTTKLILNRIFAILTGVVAGAIVMGLLETLSNKLHPLPEGLDPINTEALADHISSLPITAFLLVLIAHALGALTGGFVASKMAKVEKKGTAMYTGLILLLAGVLNLIAVPHPLWFSIIDVIQFTPMALLGNFIRKSIWP